MDTYAPPYAGGQIFSVPLFHARKALYLRAPAFSLVDAAGHISPIFDLRVRISLFFLCCLVDVSISRSQYSSGFLRLGWTLPVARHRGVKPGECRPQAGSRHQPAALARQQSAISRHPHSHPAGQAWAADLCMACDVSFLQSRANVVGEL